MYEALPGSQCRGVGDKACCERRCGNRYHEGRFPIYLAGPTGYYFNYADCSTNARRRPMACDFWLAKVFDDAFVNTDPQRVKEIQRMLYLASNNNLQVIVLTSNPSDYAGFGAREVRFG